MSDNGYADIEATEWVRARSQQRQALVENQMQMLLKKVRALKTRVEFEFAERRDLEVRLTGRIDALEEELATQRRMVASLIARGAA